MTTERPPDHPPVPRARRSVLVYVMGVVVLLACTGYAGVVFTEREFGEPERDEIPASVRSSPGGYRSYHFWHTGYQGGK